MTHTYEKRRLKTCRQCKQPFKPKGGRQVSCSWACSRDWRVANAVNETVAASKGYVWRRVPDDHPHGVRLHRRSRGLHVLEHRVVMEQHLGRYLESHEQVHHKNGRRKDNRLANLELWKRPSPSGVRSADHHCPGCRCEGRKP